MKAKKRRAKRRRKAKAQKASHCCGSCARKKRAWRSEFRRRGRIGMEDGWIWHAGDCIGLDGLDPWPSGEQPKAIDDGDASTGEWRASCHDAREQVVDTQAALGARECAVGERTRDVDWDALEFGGESAGRDRRAGEQSAGVRSTCNAAELTTSEVVAQFRRFNAEKFSGQGDPRLVEEWIQGLESIFEITEYTDRHHILCAQLQMTGDARLWWNSYWGMRPGEKEHLTWIQFKEMLEEKYYPAHYRAEMERQFLALVQGNRSVGEYEREFTRLGSFV
ncbi:Unknown protein, partial [Striga hermonthica]